MTAAAWLRPFSIFTAKLCQDFVPRLPKQLYFYPKPIYGYIPHDSDDNKKDIFVINLNEQLCLYCDMDSLPKISMSAVYPQIYEELMISNKPYCEVEAHFIKED